MKSLFRLDLIIFLLIAFVLIGCGTSRYVLTHSDFEQPSKCYVIREDIDLQGRIVSLPRNSVILFKGGKLKNGELIGDNTKICDADGSFSNVIFSGTWMIAKISTDFLASNDSLGLSNLLKLQNDNINNIVWVKAGDYFVNANKTRGALTLTSNTILRIDGNIYLKPQTNNVFYNGYYIVHVRDVNNVRIEGKGRLVGDVGNSTIKGEYGHGICIMNSDDVSVSGITIESCNGDGIVISRDCGNVIIHDINIYDYFRNGISVVGGKEIVVKNVTVENGGKVSPMAAIDVEPNTGDNVGRVHIRSLYTKNCQVGIAGYKAEKSNVGDVNISDVKIINAMIPIDMKMMNRIEIKDVCIDSCNNIEYVIRAIGNKEFLLNNISFISPNCSAKYPFYINNKKTEIINSKIECPQIFSFHLNNTLLKNCSFKYDSFVWTDQNLLTKDVVIENCSFDGPLYMRPSNVTIRKSNFSNGLASVSVPVVFEEASITDDSTPGVIFEENKIRGRMSDNTGVKSSVRNSKVSGNHSLSGTSVRYEVTGANVKVSANR